MNCRTLVRIFVTVAAAIPLTANGDSDVQGLEHNPFNRPVFVTRIETSTSAVEQPEWPHVLQATLQAGSRSLANVNGRLLSIGEEYEGYQLIRVGEGAATFSKEGATITVVVGTREEESDDT